MPGVVQPEGQMPMTFSHLMFSYGEERRAVCYKCLIALLDRAMQGDPSPEDWVILRQWFMSLKEQTLAQIPISSLAKEEKEEPAVTSGE